MFNYYVINLNLLINLLILRKFIFAKEKKNKRQNLTFKLTAIMDCVRKKIQNLECKGWVTIDVYDLKRLFLGSLSTNWDRRATPFLFISYSTPKMNSKS